MGSFLHVKSKSYQYSEDIRPSVERVLVSFYISKLTGDYWEDTMEIEADRIPIESRPEYYESIILSYSLYGSTFLTLIELIKQDSYAFEQYLLKLKNEEDFQLRSESEQKIINSYIQTTSSMNVRKIHNQRDYGWVKERNLVSGN